MNQSCCRAGQQSAGKSHEGCHDGVDSGNNQGGRDRSSECKGSFWGDIRKIKDPEADKDAKRQQRKY